MLRAAWRSPSMMYALRRKLSSWKRTDFDDVVGKLALHEGSVLVGGGLRAMRPAAG
jgi:hypothetical protein